MKSIDAAIREYLRSRSGVFQRVMHVSERVLVDFEVPDRFALAPSPVRSLDGRKIVDSS